MQDKKRGVAAGVGLGLASLLVAQNADAATEAMQLAASDNRFAVLSVVVLIALGWVGFNILVRVQRGARLASASAQLRQWLRGEESLSVNRHSALPPLPTLVF